MGELFYTCLFAHIFRLKWLEKKVDRFWWWLFICFLHAIKIAYNCLLPNIIAIYLFFLSKFIRISSSNPLLMGKVST